MEERPQNRTYCCLYVPLLPLIFLLSFYTYCPRCENFSVNQKVMSRLWKECKCKRQKFKWDLLWELFDSANMFLQILWTHNKILGQVMWGPKSKNSFLPKNLYWYVIKGLKKTTELKDESRKFCARAVKQGATEVQWEREYFLQSNHKQYLG